MSAFQFDRFEMPGAPASTPNTLSMRKSSTGSGAQIRLAEAARRSRDAKVVSALWNKMAHHEHQGIAKFRAEHSSAASRVARFGTNKQDISQMASGVYKGADTKRAMKHIVYSGNVENPVFSTARCAAPK